MAHYAPCDAQYQTLLSPWLFGLTAGDTGGFLAMLDVSKVYMTIVHDVQLTE